MDSVASCSYTISKCNGKGGKEHTNWSGSAVVDIHNSLGKQVEMLKTLCAIIATYKSTDKNRFFQAQPTVQTEVVRGSTSMVENQLFLFKKMELLGNVIHAYFIMHLILLLYDYDDCG